MARSRKSGKRSKRRSPKKSGKRSKRRSPKKSSKRSKRRSPKKSSKRSKRRSPKKSSKRSKRRSPKKTSKRSPDNDDKIIKKISSVVRKYIGKSVPQDTLLSVIKNEYTNLKNKGQLKHISEDIYDALSQAYGSEIFSKMTEKQVDSYHSQIGRLVK